MDSETARANMIEQQIRCWNVLEMQTLAALGQIRREDFVPKNYSHLCFVDTQIPLGHNQVMLEPKVCARMVEALALNPAHSVLEIGTGSGYITALMAILCNHVTSIEINAEISAQAERNLAMSAIDNVSLGCADCFVYCGSRPADADRFDRVIITGSVPDVAPLFSNMIHGDGKIVGFEGRDPAMQAVVIDGDGKKSALFETSVPRLENAEDEVLFEF